MKPAPWSFSRLSAFENCPRQFSETAVYKSVVEEKGEATIWGEVVHKHFENRLRDGVALPPEIEVHEPFMAYLSSLPGTKGVERKIALDRSARPCAFFDSDVWFRGVIDFSCVAGRFARLVDHKTGKVHSKFGQLKLFALHTFIEYPEVDEVRAEFYWTQTKTTSGATYTRDQVPVLWAQFLPALKQYAEAFETETWQPRPSGLCNGWCPVKDCEFWRPKRIKR